MERSRYSRTSPLLKRLPAIGSLAAIAAGTLVLAGWALGVSVLREMVPGESPTTPTAGTALLLSGLSLWAARRTDASLASRAVAVIFALAVAAIAITGMIAPLGTIVLVPVNSAVALFLAATALVTLCQRRFDSSKLPQWLGLGTFLVGFFALVGRAFGVAELYNPLGATPMSLWSTLALQLLGLGIIFSRTTRGFSALMVDDGPGGRMARLLLPAAIGLPFVLGWTDLILARFELYGARTGAPIIAMALITVFGWMILRSARAVQRADADRLAVVAREQHEREVAELALVTAEKASLAKSDFLAIMSHELRTPLTAIIGYEELLADGITGPVNAQQSQQLGRIKASAHHLLGLIDEILTFSRIEAGRETIRIEPVEVNRVIEDAAALVSQLAVEKSVGFLVYPLDPPRSINTDPGKVRQMIVNLLSNAVKFTQAGSVSLAARTAGDSLVITVHDTGIGIAPDNLDKVFEPFWQVEQKATRRAGGTGLGLTVTRRLARLLNGDVSVESSVGNGTTFTVILPGLAGESPSAPPTAPAS